MKYNVEEIRYLSSDREHKVYAKFIIPDKKIKGIIQISHGMNGNIGKYDRVANSFLNEGYIVCGNTHIGHIDSVNSEEELGFFGEFKGYKYLINDVKRLTKIIVERYPEKPIFLFGHSMGSLIVRCCLDELDKNVKGVILSGTIGPHALTDSGIQFADVLIQRKGYRYRSRKLYQVLFDTANRQIENHTSNYDWVTSKKEFIEDKENDFLFTVTGLRDVLNLIKESNELSNIRKIDKNLPLYFFAGSDDPVGGYGEGVKKAVALYKKAGIRDLSYKIYDGDRHECLSEENSDEVINDMINWIKAHNGGEYVD